MDIGRAFNYPKNDPQWITKLLIMGVVSIVPILNFATAGYALEAVRKVSRGEEGELPEWGNFGQYFMDGLRFFVTILAWLIPVFVVGGGVMIAGVAMGAASNDGGGLGAIVMLLGQLLMFAMELVVFAFIPALMVQLALREGFGAGFQFGGIMSVVTRNVGTYVMAILMTFVFSMVGGIGILLCGVGILVTAPYAQLASAHLFGQLARQSSDPAYYG